MERTQYDIQMMKKFNNKPHSRVIKENYALNTNESPNIAQCWSFERSAQDMFNFKTRR